MMPDDDELPVPGDPPYVHGEYTPCCTVAIDDYCTMGVTVDDHCYVALIRQEFGYWEPVHHIPSKVAALIVNHPNERCDAA